MKIEIFDFEAHSGETGSLIALECNQEIPFQVKRVYYIFGVPDEDIRRGFHAHIKLEQVFVCVSGSCVITLDDGRERVDVALSGPSRGLYVGHNTWREVSSFSHDAVLIVFASEHYDTADYIHDYDEFKERNSRVFIHEKAIVETEKIGAGTRVWPFSHVLSGAAVGENCNICEHVYIENGVTLGNNVTVKSGVFLWEGVTVEDDVFIGPAVSFCNDKYPRSKKYPKEYTPTLLKKGCSVGANATIVCGVTIGEGAMVGAGAVVTKDVPAHTTVVGTPAKIL